MITDLATFQSCIGVAKLKGQDYLNVSAEIFSFIANGQPTKYLMYNGLKVYIDGTKEKCEREERMTIDQRSKIQADEWRAANPDKI